VAVLFAREGADVAIGHLAEEDTDANETVKLVEAEGRRCLTLPGDVGDEGFCREAVERTFRTNIFAMFFLTNPALLDYSSTKGAIVAFTRSLSQQLVDKGIRVNAVAPGPIWTPLIPATMPEDSVASFGKDVPMGRPGQPEEVAPCYLFLASDDSSYMAGQVLHPNGGNVVNG
jgi:NAD(P)-dependent dehydrogenase (short-subunit alcohol dehydrogenase family)